MRVSLWLLVIAIAAVAWLATGQQGQVRESAGASTRRVEALPVPARNFDPSRFRPVSEAMNEKFPMPPPTAGPRSPSAAAIPAEDFACDGRTHCSQMQSCAEAQYFLAHCPGAKMDGNNDGEPCEQQFPECGS